MAVITSASSGNFSAPATWVGGVVPGVSDDAVAANGHVVAIDVDVTVLSVQQAGTGKFTLGNGRTLTANVIANAGTFTSGGTVDVTATTTATINGNIPAFATTTSFIAAVVFTGTGTLTFNGNITGTTGNAGGDPSGGQLYTNVTNTININGTVTGGTGTHKNAVYCGTSSNSIVTVTGTARSGVTIAGGDNSHGVRIDGPTAICNVIGTAEGLGVNSYGVNSRGTTSVINVTGTATSGSISASNYGVFASGASSTINITGTSTTTGVGTGVGSNGASATLNITGNATGRTTGNGAYLTGASSIINIVGTATGGTSTGHGVRSDATTANTGVIFHGNMVDSSTGVKAVLTRIFRMTATNSGYTQYQNNVGWPSGTPVYRVSPDNVTGMPAQSNVRKPVVYGYLNQLTGSMAVPSAASVAYGVPVDQTTGTAEFDLARAAEIIGLQVAAGKST